MGKGRRGNTEEFIKLARATHGDKYDYSQAKYEGSKKPITIICPIHGAFQQRPEYHIKGGGCPECAGNSKKTTEEFIKLAKAKHGDKYDYSQAKYVNNATPVTIICPEHGAFQQAPREHLRGIGCPACAGNIKKTTEEFIAAARKTHGNKYDYSKTEYVSNEIPVTIICPIHGAFKQRPRYHINGGGCPKCAGHERKTTDEFIEAAKKAHGDKYDYSEVEYVNGTTPVTIICPVHGAFKQAPRDHINGHECPKCAKQYMDTEYFIEKAKEIHGDRYDYSKVEYQHSKKKVCIICPDHGEFWQTPSGHLSGCGCPECAKSLNKSEKIVLKALMERYGEVSYQYTEPWLRSKANLWLDYFIPKYGIGIEYQGAQHFGPVNYFGGERKFLVQQFCDKIKFESCKAHNIPIFYISFERNKIPQNYISKVYTTLEELFNAIDIYISKKNGSNMVNINEETIRRMVEKALKENLQYESGEEEYNPDWDDYSMDNIKCLYDDDEEKFDDSQAGGEYKIDPSNPYFYTKEGKRVEADAIGQFHNDFAIVKKDGKVNYVDSDGKIISDKWFHACNDFEDGFGMVSDGTKRNFVGSNGEVLLPIWVDRAGDFVGGRAPVIIKGERHEVDKSGVIH